MKEISIFGFYGDVTIMIVSIILIILYWYFTKTFNYWRDRDVFQVDPIIFFGNLKDRILFRLSYHEFNLEMYNKFSGHSYGGMFEGRRPTLVVRDPELIKCVMVRDFEHFVDRPTLDSRRKTNVENMLLFLKGSHWKAVRSLMTPTFSSGKMKAMEELVLDCGRQMREYLRQNVKEKESNEFEMKEFFGRFTLEVIASCAFGVTSNSLTDPDAKFVKEAARFNDISFWDRGLIFFVLLFVPKLARFFTLNFFNNETLAYLAAVVQDTKRQRETNQTDRRNDFIQLMLDAAKKENENGSNILDDGTIIAQSLLFLIAGFETSSTLLSFASYELALNPGIQSKLHQEITTVLSKHNGECSYEALQEMTYLEMVLLETLRKHPPVARVDRTCTDDYLLPGTSVIVKKGVGVAIPIIGLHFDPLYYPNPQRFDPERFSPDEKAKRSPYVFLPFGSGPRNCIGMRFAMMSSKIGMIYLLRDFEVNVCAKTAVPYKYSKYSMLLKAEDGLWLDIQRRES